MDQETMVADTSLTILTDGDTSVSSRKDPANRTTEVNDTERDVTFINNSAFSDTRTDAGQRSLEMKAYARGDVSSQQQISLLSVPYTPPFTTAFQPSVKATITDTGAPSHEIYVYTRFRVLDGDEVEYEVDLGEYTTVVER